MSDPGAPVRPAGKAGPAWVWVLVCVVVVVAAVVLLIVRPFQGGGGSSGPPPSPSVVSVPSAISPEPGTSPTPQESPTNATPSASNSPSASRPSAGASSPKGAGSVLPELPAVAPKETVKTGPVQVSIARVEHVTGEPVGPGDIKDAALRFTVRISNGSDKPVNLDLVTVNAFRGPDRVPSDTYERPGSRPVSGKLAPGKSTEGVFLFRVPKAEQDDVTLVVDYLPGKPSVVFHGSFS